MAIPVIETYTEYTSTAAVSEWQMTKPTGVAVGDLLLLIVGNEDSTGTTQFPDTITGFDLEFEVGDATSDNHMAVYSRIADGTEGSTVTVTTTSADYAYGWYVRISGAHQTTFWDGHTTGQTQAAAPIDVTGRTTGVNNCLAFVFAGLDGADGGTGSVSGTGWTKWRGLASSGGSGGASGVVGTKQMATAGATGTATCDWTVSDGTAGIQFAIRESILPFIDSCTPSEFSDDDTGIVCAGSNFGATQGSGKIELGDASTYGASNLQEQTVTSWGDTSITFTCDLGTLGPGTRWLYVTDDSSNTSAGFQVTVHRAHEFVMSDSTYIAAGGANTTGQLTAPTSGTFGGGRIQDDENPTDAVDIGLDQYREDEWAIEAKSNAAAVQFQFRVTLAGTEIDTYTVDPRWTVTAGTTHNLTATIAAVTTTSTVDLDVSRALTATIAGATTTSAAALAVNRPLTATIAAATTTSTPALEVSILLTATIAAATTTPAVDLDVTRNLTATIAAATTTSAASMTVQRSLTATVSAETSTSGASLVVQRPLTATIAAATTTSTPALEIIVPLTATIAAVTTTSTPDLDIARNLTATVAAATVTSAPVLAVNRPLTATIAAATTLSTPELTTDLLLTATIAAVTTTSTPDLDVSRALTATIAAATTTSSPSLAVERPLTATVAAATTTSAAALAVERALTATIAAATVLSTPELDVTGDIQLTATIAAVTTTSSAELAVNRPLTATIAAATVLSTPELLTGIQLSANIAAVTTTSTPTLTLQKNLTATIAAATTTSSAALTVVRGLTSTVAAVTTTPAVTLAVLRPLTATIAAETVTSTPELYTLVLGAIIDPITESVTVKRAYTPVTLAREPTSVTVKRRVDEEDQP